MAKAQGIRVTWLGSWNEGEAYQKQGERLKCQSARWSALWMQTPTRVMAGHTAQGKMESQVPQV